MNAYLTEAQRGPSYGDAGYSFDRHPVLVAGDSDAALARAVRTIEASGLRIAGRVRLEQAPERISLQAAASVLWVELNEDGGAAMDRLLDQVQHDARDQRYPAIVAAPARLLDPLTARLNDSNIALLIDADDAQRTAALALAIAGAGRGDHLSDIASDKNAIRLRQLSEEVSRIASTLARLSTGPQPIGRMPDLQPPPSGEAPQVSADMVRSVIRARRLRARFFSEELFADPAWDMLLDLLQAEIAQLRVPVSSLCIAAAVPATTALRWLKTMTDEGIFMRRADPHDGRRVFVELSPTASQALRAYFAEAGKPVSM